MSCQNTDVHTTNAQNTMDSTRKGRPALVSENVDMIFRTPRAQTVSIFDYRIR